MNLELYKTFEQGKFLFNYIIYDENNKFVEEKYDFESRFDALNHAGKRIKELEKNKIKQKGVNDEL